MKKISWWTRDKIYPFLLALIVGVLGKINYQVGTWLSGWDTLHPEFNFGLYFKRIFWGVWQEHQGLGAVATQAHAAEIPRVILLWVMSWFLPDHLLRYGFFFLTLSVGVLGNYYFLKYVFRRSKSREKIAFLGGLFYLLNLTVVQQYFVPLEMFALHFGSLPWLGLFALKYVDEGKRRNLKWFGVVSLMATGIAHTATLYYVYFGLLGLWLGGYGVLDSVLGKGGSQNRLSRQAGINSTVTNLILGRVLKILGVSLVINAFWLLPNLYFVKNHSQEVIKSYINRNFTPEAFLQGEQYGTLKDLIFQKNFLFNWRVYDFGKKEFVDLLGIWKEHLRQWGVVEIGYLMFGLAMVGVVGVLWRMRRKDSWVGLSFLSVLMATVFFLINENPPFGVVFGWLREHLSLFREGFRFPFTKFSIFHIWVMSVFFGYGVDWVLKFSDKHKTRKHIRISSIFVFVLVGGMVWFAWPMFRGYLISPYMKVKIPNEYFEMFRWFKKQPMGRVAKFPVQSPWGWVYYKWGYQGAGFTWFGIPQPTLDREFDRWSPYNEGFYREISEAIYNCKLKTQNSKLKTTTQNSKLESQNGLFRQVGIDSTSGGASQVATSGGVTKGSDSSCTMWVGRVLRKYDVEYVLLDRSVIEPGKKEEVLRIPEIDRVMDELGERVWESGERRPVRGEKGDEPMLTVWKINSDQLSVISDQERVSQVATSGGVTEGSDPFVRLLSDYRVVGGTISPKMGRDVVYEEREYVEFLGSVPPRQGRGKQAPEAPLISGTDPELTLPEIFYSFAGIGTEEVEMKYVGGENVGWVVVRSSNFLPLGDWSINFREQAPFGELSPEINSWPGVVLAKRERGKLKVKVAVGVPGLRVEGGFQNRLSRQAGINSTVTNLILGDGEWIRRPEWLEGEVEFEEGKEKIDYVFLGKNWYDVSSLGVLGSVPPRQSRGKQAPEAPLISGTDPKKSWVRVGYFPVELGKTIEVRAAKKGREKQGEVWTKLVQSAKLKVQNKFSESVLPRQGRGGTDSEGMIEVWYPVWEGNDLAKRGNQKEARNCDVLGRGEVETKVIKGPTRLSSALGGLQTAKGSDPSGVGVDYKAEGYGVNCDYIPYDRYGGFENYFLIVKGENKTGRSLKIYLHSLEKDQRVILEELLPEGKFEKVYPIEVKRGGGMVLNLETRSFGRVASENVVKQVLLVPAEWGWVRKLKTQSSNPISRQGGRGPLRELKAITQNSKLEIGKVRKLGTGMYVISFTVPNLAFGERDPARKRFGIHRSPFTVKKLPILTLSQGYERGWEAFVVHRSPFTVHRLEQVRVDGWKNGFVLSDQPQSLAAGPLRGRPAPKPSGGAPSGATSDQLVVIFYWPQLLEWLGLVGLVGVLIWLWRGCV